MLFYNNRQFTKTLFFQKLFPSAPGKLYLKGYNKTGINMYCLFYSVISRYSKQTMIIISYLSFKR